MAEWSDTSLSFNRLYCIVVDSLSNSWQGFPENKTFKR